ncbi:hypothetical protein BDQ17DRAFT_1335492 [Cyathus striatus]|nr:hypothetical protein BDQ17DRAFT_1335492 [Cyathus striatus]
MIRARGLSLNVGNDEQRNSLSVATRLAAFPNYYAHQAHENNPHEPQLPQVNPAIAQISPAPEPTCRNFKYPANEEVRTGAELVSNDVKCEFRFETDIPWEDFKLLCCALLETEPNKAKLAYRLAGEGPCTAPSLLTSNDDWSSAVDKLQVHEAWKILECELKCEKHSHHCYVPPSGQHVPVEDKMMTHWAKMIKSSSKLRSSSAMPCYASECSGVINSEAGTSMSSLAFSNTLGLSSIASGYHTFELLDYPTPNMLLTSLEVENGPPFLTDIECVNLIVAGIETIADFSKISEWEFHHCKDIQDIQDIEELAASLIRNNPATAPDTGTLMYHLQ